MNKSLNKYLVCLILIVVTIIGSIYLSKKVIWKEAYSAFNPKIASTYADVIYSFANKKESTLLEVSSTIIGDEIIYLQNHQVDFMIYGYLCPYLNTSFNQLILDNFNKREKEYLLHEKKYIDENMTIDFEKEKIDFIKGYHKLANFCKSRSVR